MNESEQLRKEMNELRERVAVLESQRRPPPAPVSGGGGGSPLSPFGGTFIGSPLADAARQKQAQDEEQRRRLMAREGGPLANMGARIGVSGDGHLGLIAGALNTQFPNLGGVQMNNPGMRYGVDRTYNQGTGIEAGPPGCRCGSPHCDSIRPPEGGDPA